MGEVLTCVCPNPRLDYNKYLLNITISIVPRLVLTAGTSSVVCVWVYHKVNILNQEPEKIFQSDFFLTETEAAPAEALTVRPHRRRDLPRRRHQLG